MKWFANLALLMQLIVWPGAAEAQGFVSSRTVSTVSWVEEWDPYTQSWVRVEGSEMRAQTERSPQADLMNVPSPRYQAARYAVPQKRPAAQRALAQYGPFLVLDSNRAAIVGSTGSASPVQFDAMLRDYPGLAVLEMIEAPGTSNDIANLAVGRRIRAAGIATHVPRGGSVRSGAVELFLAGTSRTIETGAQFAVHSWLDNHGREPHDLAPDDPANRLYLDYYQEMGMSKARATAFYAMTNSVPHASAKWLRADEMRRWIAPEVVSAPEPALTPPIELPVTPLAIAPFERAPQIAYGPLQAMTLASLRPLSVHAFLDS